MPLISCTNAAREFSDAFGRRIRPGKVERWLSSGRLTDHGTSTTPRLRVDSREVEAIIRDVRYEPNPPPHMAYRVSVGPLMPDRINDPNGSLWRTHAGIDYQRTLSKQDRRRAIAGVWPTQAALADRLARGQAWLIPADAGLVDPSFVRVITGWQPMGGRVAFTTSRPTTDLQAWVGTGIFIDVQPGPISAPLR